MVIVNRVTFLVFKIKKNILLEGQKFHCVEMYAMVVLSFYELGGNKTDEKNTGWTHGKNN